MTRIEVIANQSVQPDLLEALNRAIPDGYYTLWRDVLGRGGQGTRRGDPIWPERNVVLLAYVPDTAVMAIRAALVELKERFPREGITLFELPGAREVELKRAPSGQSSPGQ